MWAAVKNWAARVRRDTLALWFAVRDRRTPLWLRSLGYLIIAYALSPIDLIPDFLPVIGYLDELILLPAGLWLMIRLMPAPLLEECRSRADSWIAQGQERPRSKLGAAIVIVIWITVVWWLVSIFSRPAIG
ncbi:MAG: DUF1232 domain-containing protein [Betaproteobacteria bacterium]|nr:MAG: DUF1232 domain-containing protein [Betaproteobacteria bacterium]